MKRNPFFLKQFVGESGQTWVIDTTETAAMSTNRGSPYLGWREGEPDEPTVWVVRHWLLPDDGTADRDHLHRSFDLAQLEAIRGCPHFLRVLDRAHVTDFDDYLSIVSELAASTLEHEIEPGLPAAERDALKLAVTEALKAIHSEGFVHSDVTPSNIFKVGAVWKLGDLGAAVRDGEPIRELPRNRRFVPDGYDYGVPATPALDLGCLKNILASLAP